MRKTIIFLFLMSIASFSFAQVSDLVSMLSNEMDITNEQAEGGAGSLFNFAQEGMSSADFSALSDAVPDMSGLLGAVPALTGGKKKSWLGKAADSLTGMPAVQAQFKKLGLSETHVALMTPLLVDYVEKKGGEVLSNSFASAIGL